MLLVKLLEHLKLLIHHFELRSRSRFFNGGLCLIEPVNSVVLVLVFLLFGIRIGSIELETLGMLELLGVFHLLSLHEVVSCVLVCDESFVDDEFLCLQGLR